MNPDRNVQNPQLVTTETGTQEISFPEVGDQQRPGADLTGHSQLMVPVEMLDDVAILQKKLRSLSRTSLVLSQKYFQQQQIIDKVTKQLEETQKRHEDVQEENKSLAAQLQEMKKIERTVQEEVNFRQHLLVKSSQNDKNELLAEKEIIITNLKQENKQLQDIILEQQQLIRDNNDRIETSLDKEKMTETRSEQILEQLSSSRQQASKMQQASQSLTKQIESLRTQVDLLKIEKNELEKKLLEKEQLVELSTSNSTKTEKELLIIKEEVNQLASENIDLKRHNTSLSSQCSELKDRLQNFTGTEKDLEHIIIDRFIQVIHLYRDRLIEGGISLKPNIDIKKDSFIKRMNKEYMKFLQKNQ